MVRIKHRYLLINILYPNHQPSKSTPPQPEEPLPWTVEFQRPSSDRLDSKLLNRMIRDGVAELFGDYGAGMVAGSLQIKYCSSATNTAIIRVGRAHYRMVWAALSFVTRLPKPIDDACVIQVVRVSGTIKKSEEEAIRRARLAIVRAQRSKAGPGLSTFNVEGETGDADHAMANGIEDSDGQDEDDD